ncbi:hypothetical protein OAC97_02135 [Flavobacteriaceae bacterium]|jgi:CDP-diacylglycerol pyrophosphatase|nr:hypothetical protein [Flavobacteriaceae bacterium]|tara:strand:+ start:195 stop:644 length:450 start_codon:yes stop_codon:yes gene_type:complete
MKSKPKNDFLKYWRVARNFMRVRYNLSDPDLDMLLFLYSEEYFTRDTYKEYAKLFSWQTNRFYRLIDEGWIENHQKKQKLTKALYGTTYKTTRVIGSLYKKLNGEPYPESYQSNPLYFKTKVPLSHKLYGKYIKKINASIEQQRRRSLE